MSLLKILTFNGTKEIISSVTLYLSIIPPLQIAEEAVFEASFLVHHQTTAFKLAATLQNYFDRFSSFFNLPDYSQVSQTDFINVLPFGGTCL